MGLAPAYIQLTACHLEKRTSKLLGLPVTCLILTDSAVYHIRDDLLQDFTTST